MINAWLTADWPVAEHIRAGCSLRAGGVSSGVYHGLNLATHVGDQLVDVERNRHYLQQQLKLPTAPIWLDQVHGNRVIQVYADTKVSQADASFTCDTGVVCAVLTADCLPVLLCDEQGTCVAAVHAGWRGLLSGVLENTVQAMYSQHVMAWLGPAIGPDCFEVGDEVWQLYVAKSDAFKTAFQQCSETKWLADIYHLARITLNMIGIEQVFGGQFCTVTDAQRFYSYRRDGVTGRMASMIWKT